MKEIHFQYLHGIVLLKNGIRENSNIFLDTARESLSPLFCSRNRKNYIFLDTLNNINKHLIPAEFHDFIKKNESLKCRDGVRNEALDFIVKQMNKKVKFWLPIGVPNDNHWIKVTRNLGNLDKVKKLLFV